ncbi:DUF6882 domain-containing protein [Chryseolinea sp. T2]|uniref:DUF6882 domain-containing protein n=1 Tax=Chryseolinea sp. T2 TaxID=3129255 RepID=UPI003077302C
MLNEAFESYKDQCVEHLSVLQEEFMKLYDIESYEHWFYDHGIGAFHFKSDDGRNLYFKYVEVGSFSTERNTWMWSWENDSVPKHVIRGIEKVKAFGQQRGFNTLLEGVVADGDDYTGWALTAITAKLLSAIGAYRAPHEHLLIYFVFTNELTQEQYDELKNKYVECEAHGMSRVAFVCQHLLKGSNLGFHETIESNPLTDPDDDYQAWCDDCEIAWIREGEWNATFKAFVDLKIVCDQCYFESKRRNISEGG